MVQGLIFSYTHRFNSSQAPSSHQLKWNNLSFLPFSYSSSSPTSSSSGVSNDFITKPKHLSLTFPKNHNHENRINTPTTHQSLQERKKPWTESLQMFFFYPMSVLPHEFQNPIFSQLLQGKGNRSYKIHGQEGHNT